VKKGTSVKNILEHQKLPGGPSHLHLSGDGKISVVDFDDDTEPALGRLEDIAMTHIGMENLLTGLDILGYPTQRVRARNLTREFRSYPIRDKIMSSTGFIFHPRVSVGYPKLVK
jgi:hypothetical protein